MLKRSIIGLGLGLALVAGLSLPARSNAAEANDGGWLGVYSQTLDSGLRDGMEYEGNGVVVNRVVAGSPAERAGIRRGDVIVSVNSRAVNSSSELSDIVQDMHAGQNATVKVNRGGTSRTFSVTLGSRPSNLDEPGDLDWRRGNDDESDGPPVPEMAPRAPRAPRTPRTPDAPRAPRSYRWNGQSGDGDVFNFDDLGNGRLLPGMGRGRLGIQIQDLDPDLSGYFGGTNGRGVLVLGVMDGTPAKNAGIKAGDVITRVGNDAVDDTRDLLTALRSRDGRVALTVVRRGTSRTIEANLPARDDMNGRMLRLRDLPRMQELDGNDQDGHRIVRKYKLQDDQAGDDVRREMEDLKRELRDLRRQLEEERARK